VEVRTETWTEASGPDVDGVYWQENFQDNGPPVVRWLARKLYWQNVELRWWTPDRSVDARWRELDAILSAVA
jgi:hypothetical protein